MARGQRIDNGARSIMCNLLKYHSAKEVAALSNVSKTALYRVAAYYEQNGKHPSPKKRRKGVPRAINEATLRVSVHISLYCLAVSICRLTLCKYLIGRIQQLPDLYLEELQAELRRKANITVSISTIWRVLRTQGLTYKVVSLTKSLQLSFTHPLLLGHEGCQGT
jgi:transposase